MGAKWRLAYEDDRNARLRATILNISGKSVNSEVSVEGLLGRALVKIDERPEAQPPLPTEAEQEKAERAQAILEAHNRRMNER